jgi:hypothetical protein
MKRAFRFSLQINLKYFLFWEELSEIRSRVYVDLYTKYPLFLFYFSKSWIFRGDFRKILKYKTWLNPFSRSQVVPCKQTDGHEKG